MVHKKLLKIFSLTILAIFKLVVEYMHMCEWTYIFPLPITILVVMLWNIWYLTC